MSKRAEVVVESHVLRAPCVSGSVSLVTYNCGVLEVNGLFDSILYHYCEKIT